MNGVYIGDGKVVISPAFGGKMVVPSTDLSVSLELISSGVFEVPLTKYILKTVQAGQTIVDIGANIGYYSVLFGYLVGTNGKVIAYEANPDAYFFLMDNLSINYLHDRTEIYNKAVYSLENNLSFYKTKRYIGNSSIHQHNEEYFKHYNDDIEEIQIEAVSLDEHLHHIKQIDIMKIDIEGGEYQAFLGMRKILKNRIVKTLIFEVNSNMLQNDWQPFCELITEIKSENNTAFFTLTSEGDLSPIDLNDILSIGANPYVIAKFENTF